MLRVADSGVVSDLLSNAQQDRDVSLPNGQVVRHERLRAHVRRKQDASYGRRYHRRQGVAGMQRPISPPGYLYVSERVLFQSRAYVVGRFTGVFKSTEQVDALRRPSSMSAHWLEYCNSIAGALERKQWHGCHATVIALLRKAPFNVLNLLESEAPNLLGSLFYLLLLVTRQQERGQDEEREQTAQLFTVVRSLIRYVSMQAAKTLPPPLSSLLASLEQVDGATILHEIAAQAWRISCEAWDGVVRDMGVSCANIISWLNLATTTDSSLLPPQFEQLLEKGLEYRARTCGRQSREYCEFLMLMARYLDVKEHERADERQETGSIDSHERRFDIWTQVLETVPDVAIQGHALFGLARMYKRRGDLVAAETYLRWEIEATISFRGEQHPFVIMALGKLAGWLREWDRQEEAEGVGHWRQELLLTHRP